MTVPPSEVFRRELAAEGRETASAQKPLWEIIAEIARSIPEEHWARIPSDASYQLDHYLYGAPKKSVP